MDRHAFAYLHFLHIHVVIAEFLSVPFSYRTIPIMLPQVSINLGRLGRAPTQLGIAGTSGYCQKLPTARNCRKLCDNFVANGDQRGGNPFKKYLDCISSVSNPSLVAETDFKNRFKIFSKNNILFFYFRKGWLARISYGQSFNKVESD